MFISRSQGFFCYLVPIEYAVTVVCSIITKSTCAKRIMIKETKKLLCFAESAKMLTEFSDELFTEYVDSIIVYTRAIAPTTHFRR